MSVDDGAGGRCVRSAGLFEGGREMPTGGKSQMGSKVKKLVLADQRVGKVAKITYTALTKATEVFVCNVFKSMSELAVDYESNPRILKASHLKQRAKEDPTLSFLRRLPAVEGAPDFELGEKVERASVVRATEGKSRKVGTKKRKAVAKTEAKQKPKRPKCRRLKNLQGELVESDRWADTMAEHLEAVQ